MEQQSNAQETTQSLQKEDGSKPLNWRSAGFRTVSKACVCCGKVFMPTTRMDAGKEVASNSYEAWMRQEVCSRSCSKKLKNPMSNPESRAKMKARLLEIKHRPIRRGGNGKLLPLPQLALLHALGDGWQAELVVDPPDGEKKNVAPGMVERHRDLSRRDLLAEGDNAGIKEERPALRRVRDGPERRIKRLEIFLRALIYVFFQRGRVIVLCGQPEQKDGLTERDRFKLRLLFRERRCPI